MSYQTFEQRWLGKVTNPDGVAGYQCVDVPKQFLHEEKGLDPKGSYGNAKDWWLNTHPKVLEVCDKLPANSIQAGDILPLRPVDNHPSHSAGHIGQATGAQTATTVEILEQNGSTGNGKGEGGDRIRKRFVPKSRVYGVLRPKAPTPPPAPAQPGHPLAWTVGKVVRLKAASHRVYPAGSMPPRDHLAYTLRPNKPGVRSFLDYHVLRTDKALNSVVIRTLDKGEQSCPIASNNNGALYPDVEIR